MQIQQIDIDLIGLAPGAPVPVLDPHLVDEITDLGVLTPAVVSPCTDDRFVLVRYAEIWRAAQQARLSSIPCVVLGDNELPDDANATTNPIAEAQWLARHMRMNGLKGRGAVSALARRLGLRREAVSHKLRLLKLCGPVRNLVASGKLSAGHARALVALDAVQQQALAHKILHERWSVRTAEAFAQGRADDGKSQPALDPDVTALEQRLSEQLGARVNLTEGELRIAYHDNLEILDGILSRLGLVP